ncbi:hypothetical protein A3731_20415 [Roseovarius sp. HI0049]|nr:hypothetical protein A3731_20415 [Roseovarius sp. HI0049]
MDWTAALEAQPAVQALRASRWVYPVVNAGHILGSALLVGAIVPMDLRLLRGDARPFQMLRPFAIAGLCLAALCGVMLFAVQAEDYAANSWFRVKMALLALAVANAVAHLRLLDRPAPRQRVAAGLSLVLWLTILFCGRMIAYS